MLDGQDNLATVRGRSEVSRQLARLVQALDSPVRGRDRATRIVPFRLADPVKVKQALDAYRGQTPPGPGPSSSGISAPTDTGRVGPRPQSRVQRGSGIALVSYIFQTEPPAGGAGAPADTPPLPGGDQEAQRAAQLRALGMDVEVETLPDLDIVILRGRQQDVEELARIIEELERLSAEAEPEIQVYPLRHVRAQRWPTSSNRFSTTWSAAGRAASVFTPWRSRTPCC